jgi:hypothetical protein
MAAETDQMIGGHNKRRQFQKSTRVKCTVSQELLWLWSEDISGTQEEERPLLEAGTRRLVKGQQTGKAR